MYNPDQKTKSGKKAKKITQELVLQGRANYVAAADYSEGSPLFKIIQLSIDSLAAEIELLNYKK